MSRPIREPLAGEKGKGRAGEYPPELHPERASIRDRRVRPLQRKGVSAPVERHGVSRGGTRGGTANVNSPSVPYGAEGFCLSL